MEDQINEIKQDLAKGELLCVPMIDQTGISPLVVHSTGLSTTAFGAELVIVGPSYHDQLPLLVNILRYGMQWAKTLGREPVDGEKLPLPPTASADTPAFVVKLALASELEAFPLPMLGLVYDQPVKVWQMLVPDPEGKLPDDEGYKPEMLLGQRMFWNEGGAALAVPHMVGANCHDRLYIEDDHTDITPPPGALLH